jgi:NDP-sugar pyrophosphorylase family protein
MTTPPTLLILAAGMGSRYGSLKQIDHFGPNGETIIDYSIYDAIKAGFGKVVFVIRESIEEEFKEVVIDKYSDIIETDYVAQELDMLPEGFSVPEKRVKPWGTGQAVLVASSKINEPFAVINADDFYGYKSFKLAADFLKAKNNEPEHALVGFKLNNTLSAHGAVARGVCKLDGEDYLQNVTEHLHIVESENKIISSDPDGAETVLNGDETVSMNLMAFTPSVFPYFEKQFREFMANKSHKSLKSEFLLPDVVNHLVESRDARVKVLFSPEKWFGVTFPDDKPITIKKLKDLIAEGIYPENLWERQLNNI